MFRTILILTPFNPDGIGGAETFVKSLIQEASKKHEVILCTLKPRKKTWKGTSLKNLFSVYPLLMFKATLAVLKHRPDIIHAQGLISGLIAGLLKWTICPLTPVYITLLALYEFQKWPRWKLMFVKFTFFWCDKIFVEGENGKENIKWFNQEQKIQIFNHWVDQDRFKPADRLEKDRQGNKIKVLFVGRPIPEKGRHIIEEAERLINQPDKYEFTYVKNVSYEELPAIYQSHDILVVPSLYAEGYVRVVAEGASCGCKVIVSNKGSLPEMVYPWGLVREPISTEFAEAITIGINQPDVRDKFSVKNYEVFGREYEIA